MGDWRYDAACLEEDPELFFPIGNTGPAVLQIEEAKAVCRRCDVTETCLNWALDNGQDAGVWGGLSEGERRALKKRRYRARAPKPERKTYVPKPPSERLLVPVDFTLKVVQEFRKGPEPLSWKKIGQRLHTSDSVCRAIYSGQRKRVSRAVEETARKLADAQ